MAVLAYNRIYKIKRTVEVPLIVAWSVTTDCINKNIFPQVFEGNLVNPQQIKPVKRGRPPKVNQDDPSSGKNYLMKRSKRIAEI